MQNGPFGRHNEQIDWLKADLANVDRSLTPWVVVNLHRPWFTSVSPPTYPAWQEAFEQVRLRFLLGFFFSSLPFHSPWMHLRSSTTTRSTSTSLDTCTPYAQLSLLHRATTLIRTPFCSTSVSSPCLTALSTPTATTTLARLFQSCSEPQATTMYASFSRRFVATELTLLPLLLL